MLTGPASARRKCPTRPTTVRVAAAIRPLALLLALAGPMLAGCARSTAESSWWNPAGIGPAPQSPPPATDVVLPARAADPLAAFAARARQGQAESVQLPQGVVSARMVRAYNAASGRECRELQFGPSGIAGGAPGATYCNDPSQGWVAARALLRGGAVYRP
ncbi:hypothetical protein FHS87_000182 [Roseomonas pecuniae]|uniref:Common-antigen outer membrane protein n=2 Tax=Muricoccus pecuniae TaxID=693023 RepID=A0A840Y8A4_9PROT|nr:hypothetical protein [Roseomonas pecuniae]